jgi:hypothetical protein
MTPFQEDQKTIRELRDELKRLRDALEDACKVFDHYDLPEHAFHYRRRQNIQAAFLCRSCATKGKN